MRRTAISLILIFTLISGSLYSTSLSCRLTNYKRHKKVLLKTIKETYPVVLELLSIFKSIRCVNDFKKVYTRTQKLWTKYQKAQNSFNELERSLPSIQRSKFESWAISLSPDFFDNIIKLRRLTRKISKIPECLKLLSKIKKKSAIQNETYPEFKKYKKRITKLFDTLLPTAKRLYNALKKITNKKQLLKEQKNIIKIFIKIVNIYAPNYKLEKQMPFNKKLKFEKWLQTLNPGFFSIMDEIEKENRRLKKISGCTTIILNIQKKLLLHVKRIKKKYRAH